MIAIVIDGMALLSLKDPLGIRRINFRRLYNILTNGGRNLLHMPLITLRPDVAAGLGKALRSLGFKVISVPTERGEDGISQDDAYLVEHLTKLDAKKVSKVMLLGTDADLLEAFLKKVQAIAAEHPNESCVRGYILGTRRKKRRTGTSSVGHVVETLLSEYPGLVEFVELTEHAKELEYEPVVYQPPTPVIPPPPEEVAKPEAHELNGHGPGSADGNDAEQGGLRVIIDLSESGLNTDLLNEIMALQRRFPGLAMHFN